MGLAAAVLSGYGLALLAPWLARAGRGATGWLVALLPAGLTLGFDVEFAALATLRLDLVDEARPRGMRLPGHAPHRLVEMGMGLHEAGQKQFAGTVENGDRRFDAVRTHLPRKAKRGERVFGCIGGRAAMGKDEGHVGVAGLESRGWRLDKGRTIDGG